MGVATRTHPFFGMTTTNTLRSVFSWHTSNRPTSGLSMPVGLGWVPCLLTYTQVSVPISHTNQNFHCWRVPHPQSNKISMYILLKKGAGLPLDCANFKLPLIIGGVSQFGILGYGYFFLGHWDITSVKLGYPCGLWDFGILTLDLEPGYKIGIVPGISTLWLWDIRISALLNWYVRDTRTPPYTPLSWPM